MYTHAHIHIHTLTHTHSHTLTTARRIDKRDTRAVLKLYKREKEQIPRKDTVSGVTAARSVSSEIPHPKP